MDQRLYNKILQDPWNGVKLCLQNRCSPIELRNIIETLLSKPIDTNDYKTGLKLVMSIKSQSSLEFFIRIIKGLSQNILENLEKHLEPENIIKWYLVDETYGYGLIILLSTYPLLGKYREFVNNVEKTIDLSEKLVKRPEKYRDFYSAFIHGIIPMSTPSILNEIIEYVVENMGHHKLHTWFKAYLLSNIIQYVPSKILEENPSLIKQIAKLYKNVVEENILLIEKEPYEALEIYSEINVFTSYMWSICRELDNREICRRIFREPGESLNEMYSRLKEYVIRYYGVRMDI